jgi:hypothetical protein
MRHEVPVPEGAARRTVEAEVLAARSVRLRERGGRGDGGEEGGGPEHQARSAGAGRGAGCPEQGDPGGRDTERACREPAIGRDQRRARQRRGEKSPECQIDTRRAPRARALVHITRSRGATGGRDRNGERGRSGELERDFLRDEKRSSSNSL